MWVWRSLIFRDRRSGPMTIRCVSTTLIVLAREARSFRHAVGRAVSRRKCFPRTGSNDLRMMRWTSKPAGRDPRTARRRLSIRSRTVRAGQTTSTTKAQVPALRPTERAEALKRSR